MTRRKTLGATVILNKKGVLPKQVRDRNNAAHYRCVCGHEWVLETAGRSRSLLVSVKEMKLAYYGHIFRKKGDCSEKELLLQGTTPGSHTQGR